MKFIKNIIVFLFLSSIFTCYAHENKQIFIGKMKLGEKEKVAFILNLLEKDVEKYLYISEKTGEIFLKADSLIKLSKEDLI